MAPIVDYFVLGMVLLFSAGNNSTYHGQIGCGPDENRSSEIGGRRELLLHYRILRTWSDIVPDSDICQPDTPANNIIIAEAIFGPREHTRTVH